MLKRVILGSVLALWSASAEAQWQVPLGSVPVGRGPGVTGFNSVAGSGGTGTKCIVDTSPPTFVTCPGGGGGTPGGSNLQVQFNNAGSFGGLTDVQLTARIQLFSSTLSGAVPASGGGTTTFLRADGTWASPGGSGNVTTSVTLTANRIVLGNGTQDVIVLGSLGTTTTVLHGNAGGAPTFGSVVSADLNITTTSCTNQFVTAISAGGVGTCTTDVLASAQHANQGTATTLLHGNAAGNPAWSAVVSADMNITTTSCSATQFVNAISAGGVGTCAVAGGGVTGLANPSATIGLTAVNGSATTALRSDGASALSQAIAPTWTAAHIWSVGTAAAITATSTSASALAVGRQGATDPVLKINANTASVATGVEIVGAAAASGVTIRAISPGTNEALTVSAKGNEVLTLNFNGGQTRIFGTSGTVALAFVNDNLSGFGSRTTLEVNAYINSAETMRWAQTVTTSFATFLAASTLQSNVTRTVASAASVSLNDVQVVGSTTTFSGSTNITNNVAKTFFAIPIFTASGAAISIGATTTVYIEGPPSLTGAGGFTPTTLNPFALYVASGKSDFVGPVDMDSNVAIGGLSSSVSDPQFLKIAAGTTAKAQINFAASTAPTSPNNGDHWFEAATGPKWRIGGVTTGLAGGGTVTNVSFTGGLISVANPTSTPALTVAGTSGGIPYFSGATTWASSAALTANLPVIGGGAGVAPSVGTRSGNTTAFVTTTGTLTSGRCAEWDASANLIQAAAACGGGGGLTVGTTAIASGVVGKVLYEGSGNVLNETDVYLTPGTGVASLTLNTSTVLALLNVGATPSIQIAGGTGTVGMQIASFSTSQPGRFQFYRTPNGGTVGGATVVTSGDILGEIRWLGAQQTGTFSNNIVAAVIKAEVDGTVTSGAGADMPGRLVFQTTPDGSGTPADRFVINNAGQLTITTAPSSDSGLNTSTLCRETSTGLVKLGSGTVGVCAGTSSARFKDNVVTLTDGLAKLVLLQPKSFNYKEGYGFDVGKKYNGFTAEAVQDVLPGLVDKDVNGAPSSVDLLGIIPILVQAMQEIKIDLDKKSNKP